MRVDKGRHLEDLARRLFAHTGLGEHCAAVYAELARLSAATLAELAESCRRPLAEIEDAVDELARRGFVRRSGEAGCRVTLLQPDAGLAATVNSCEDSAAEQLRRLSEVRLISTELSQVVSGVLDREELVSFELLHDTESIVTRLHELNHHTQDEILTCVPLKPMGASVHEARAADAQLLERGVRVSGLYLQSCRNDPALMEYFEWMTLQGADIRLAPTLPTRFQVFDGSVAVVAMAVDGSSPGAILVRNPGLVAALQRLFEILWQSAEPAFGADSGKADHELSAQQRELIRLLARGAKDESVARQMGVSVRTVRRAISELGVQLGAASRFELGVKCAAAGWTEATARTDAGRDRGVGG